MVHTRLRGEALAACMDSRVRVLAFVFVYGLFIFSNKFGVENSLTRQLLGLWCCYCSGLAQEGAPGYDAGVEDSGDSRD